MRASAGRRPRRRQQPAPKPKRSEVGLGHLVTPATSVVALAGAWLAPVTPDERAALLTAAAAASTLAALRGPSSPRQKKVREPKEVHVHERVEDLEALIAAW